MQKSTFMTIADQTQLADQIQLADRIRQIRLKIDGFLQETPLPEQQVRLLAVSKTHPASAVQSAFENGVTEFGESYLQESLDKIKACKSLSICWHFIGPVQSNKTRAIAENFDWVQSVDRSKILKRLNEQRPTSMGPIQVCIQANLFDEPQKKGATRAELPELLAIAEQLPNISLRGLMVIPPRQSEMKEQLRQFNQVSQLYNQLKQQFGSMDTLSMGMSNDIHAAIQAGSNMVRVGTAIFGARGTNHQ